MSLDRIASRFAALQAADRKALIVYLTAGDPAPVHTPAAMHGLVAGGADIIELGLPFTDPEAEGPSIQAACERALAAGTGIRATLDALRAFRRDDDSTPVVLMGYLNMAEWWGYERFADAVVEAGGDGCLFVNMPPEESERLDAVLAARNLAHVYLLAPTTSPERARLILGASTGFAYYVSLKGTTGSGHIDAAEVADRVAALRTESAVPLVVGFGVRTPATARILAPSADGVVVGSAVVDCIGSHQHSPEAIPEDLRALAAGFRQALDG